LGECPLEMGATPIIHRLIKKQEAENECRND